MTNGNSSELLPCPFCGGKAERSFNEFYRDDSMASCCQCGASAYWKKWQRRASLSVCADGGKGEAVRFQSPLDGRWITAPQAECAPREAQPVAKIDADGDFVWLVHNPKFAEGTEFYASPTPERADTAPLQEEIKRLQDEVRFYRSEHRTLANMLKERADAEKDAALTNEQIEAAIEAWFDTDGKDVDDHQSRMSAAILAAREERNREHVRLNAEWMAKCEELRSVLNYIEKRARTTDYDAGWIGVWDIRGVPAWNDMPDNKFNHRTFIDAIKAEMAKKEGA